MSNTGDIYGKNSNDGDFCPNCGAVKLFSALVCPACGANYAEAGKQRSETSGAPITQVFDPNASFAKFKNSLDKNEDTEEKDGDVKPEETVDTTVDTAEEIDDPIKRKLAEITKKNSGMSVKALRMTRSFPCTICFSGTISPKRISRKSRKWPQVF